MRSGGTPGGPERGLNHRSAVLLTHRFALGGLASDNGEMKLLRFCCLSLCSVLSVLPLHSLENQPASVYHQRRVALAAKLHGGVAILFAAEEAQLDLTPYRQDED